MKKIVLFLTLCSSVDGWAKVYKCTDPSGRVFYQSAPCTEEHKAVEINPKTGSTVDISAQRELQASDTEARKQQALQQQAEDAAKAEALVELRARAKAEAELTQALVKQNPLQFSVYAIPAYDPDKLPETVKPYAARLPEIEKYRRLAAQKALNGGECRRVEADDLNYKSKPDMLVFLVNCSTGASLYFNENELKP